MLIERGTSGICNRREKAVTQSIRTDISARQVNWTDENALQTAHR